MPHGIFTGKHGRRIQFTGKMDLVCRRVGLVIGISLITHFDGGSSGNLVGNYPVRHYLGSSERPTTCAGKKRFGCCWCFIEESLLMWSITMMWSSQKTRSQKIIHIQSLVIKRIYTDYPWYLCHITTLTPTTNNYFQIWFFRKNFDIFDP